MIRTLAWAMAGGLWGGICLVAGLYLSFPEELARERFTWEVSDRSHKEYAAEAATVGPWWFSGIAMDDVTFYTVKKGRRSKDNPNPEMERTPFVHFDNLGVRMVLPYLIVGKQAIAFAAEMKGGAIDGFYSTSEALTQIELDVSSLDLAQMPYTSGGTELHLMGSLSAAAELSLDTKDVKNSTGFLTIDFTGFGLGAGTKISGFDIGEVLFSQAAVSFEVKDGKMTVTRGDFISPMISATLSGDITLNKKLGRSRNRLDLSFTLPEDIDQLAQLSPELKRSRDEDGSYHATISGTILEPTFRTTGARGGAASKVGTSLPNLSRGGALGRDGDDTEEDMSEEERKAAREERLKERRERLKERRKQAEERRKNGDYSTGEDAEAPVGKEFPSENFENPGRFPEEDRFRQPEGVGPVDAPLPDGEDPEGAGPTFEEDMPQ